MKTCFRATALYLMFFCPFAATAQFRLGVSAGTTYNALIRKDSKPNQSPDLYGSRPGFTLGIVGRYALNERLSLSSELSWQVLPYTNKYETGAFYPSYLTASLAPVYKISPWLKAEGGIGSGLTLSSRFEHPNDPLLFSFLGFRVPVKNWEFNVRYYRFLKPVSIQDTPIGGERSSTRFYDHGIQLGLTYFFH
jgi:hypothetical protein